MFEIVRNGRLGVELGGTFSRLDPWLAIYMPGYLYIMNEKKEMELCREERMMKLQCCII